jgi:hypothetical protein
MSRDVWQSKDGPIQIVDMDDKHLRNTIKLLYSKARAHMQHKKEELGPEDYVDMPDYIRAMDEIEALIKDPTPWLLKHKEQFPALCQEFMRRELTM